jgi:hypothetical protein
MGSEHRSAGNGSRNRDSRGDTISPVFGSKLAALYYAVPTLTLAGNVLWVVRPELALPIDRRADARLTRPLARGERCVEWTSAESPGAARRDGRLRVEVTVKNCGPRPWPDVPWGGATSHWGEHAVRFGARWTPAAAEAPGRRLVWRGELPHAVLPGDSVTLPLYVPAPTAPDRYVLELDLVQETVAWFSDEGVKPLRLGIDVR